MSLEDDADQEAKDVTRKGARPAVSSCITFHLFLVYFIEAKW